MNLSLPRLKTLPVLPALLLSITGLASLHSQNINPAFTLNDPSLFWPGTNAGGAPGYPGQWYLQNEVATNPNNAGLDANVAGSWMDGFDGTGVTIAICDQGVQGSHPDLKYNASLSWDFSQSAGWNHEHSTSRGFPTATNDSHGTGCAGVAAGIGNGIGIVGAAPNASIVSEAIFGKNNPGEDPNKFEAAIYIWEGQKNAKGESDPYTVPSNWDHPYYLPPIRVKNHSYSANTAYLTRNFKTEGFLSQAIQACSDHKIINVLSAGNERAWPKVSNNALAVAWIPGTTSQDTGKKFVNSFPGQIITAALSSDGTFAKYSSFGACVFVTAPSDDSPWNFDRTGNPLPIVSTDLAGPFGGNNTSVGSNEPLLNYGSSKTNKQVISLYNYDSLFGGTSAAAPLVAGIMADGVTADPYLDVRTAQHLLTLTSRHVDPNDQCYGGWVTNAAGYAFDPNYGFGLIDGTAFTTACSYVYDALAIGYRPMSDEEKISASSSLSSKKPAYLVNIAKKINTNSVSIPVTLPKSKSGFPLESVKVKIVISGFQTNQLAYLIPVLGSGVGANLGDITIRVISPRKTSALSCISDNFAIPNPVAGGLINPQLNLCRDLDKGIYINPKNFQTSLNWQYLSWAFYGEQPNGVWTVKIINTSLNHKYTKDLKVESVALEATCGSFDSSVLGDLPLANGPTAIR